MNYRTKTKIPIVKKRADAEARGLALYWLNVGSAQYLTGPTVCFDGIVIRGRAAKRRGWFTRINLDDGDELYPNAEAARSAVERIFIAAVREAHAALP